MCIISGQPYYTSSCTRVDVTTTLIIHSDDILCSYACLSISFEYYQG